MKKPKSTLGKVLKVVAIVLALLIAATILMVVFLRASNYFNHKLQLANGINESEYLDVNGQKQYILMTGKDTSNPVIIYLHGGPSSPDTCVAYNFVDHLMDEYTFIGWDQRGCGRTYYKNIEADPESKTASFEQALEDLDEIVDYARERFGQEKVIIMGHSYGTVLGSTYVRAHPDKVSTYIGIGQMVSLERADVYSYNDALSKAQAAGDDTTEMEKAFDDFKNNPEIPTLLTLRNLTSKYHPAEKHGDYLGLALFSPYSGIDDIKWFIKQLGDIHEYVALNQQLFDYVLKFDALEEDLNYEMPVYFISGSEDWVCPVQSTQEYYEKITAPKKDFRTIEKCGHDVQLASSREFSQLVKELLAD